MTALPHPLATATARLVPLSSINMDNQSQAREKTRSAVVGEYAQAMAQQKSEGAWRFPPIVLFTEDDRLWIGDGFHRLLAAQKAKLTEIPAEVRPGSQRDALLFSISSNADHGLPRTNADKRKAVQLLLADPEWSRWSNHEIARRSQVTQPYICELRRGASGNNYQMRSRKVRRGDQVYEMKVEPAGSPLPAPANDPKEACHPIPVPTIVADEMGNTLRPQTATAFASRVVFETAEKLHAQLAGVVDQIARSPGGAAYLQHLGRRLKDGKIEFFSPELQVSARKLMSAEPHCGSCPRCLEKHGGQAHSACKLCGGRGWLSKSEWDSCPQHERQELERLRNQ